MKIDLPYVINKDDYSYAIIIDDKGMAIQKISHTTSGGGGHVFIENKKIPEFLEKCIALSKLCGFKIPE